MLPQLVVLVFPIFFDKSASLKQIIQAVNQQCFSGFPISSSPTDLLIVGFHASREVGVRYKSYVWFIYTHSKRDCGCHDSVGLRHEPVLVFAPGFTVQSGMIGNSVVALCAKEFGGFFCLFP